MYRERLRTISEEILEIKKRLKHLQQQTIRSPRTEMDLLVRLRDYHQKLLHYRLLRKEGLNVVGRALNDPIAFFRVQRMRAKRIIKRWWGKRVVSLEEYADAQHELMELEFLERMEQIGGHWSLTRLEKKRLLELQGIKPHLEKAMAKYQRRKGDENVHQ